MIKGLVSWFKKGEAPPLQLSWTEHDLRISSHLAGGEDWSALLQRLASTQTCEQHALAQRLREWLEQGWATENLDTLLLPWDALHAALADEPSTAWLAPPFPGQLHLETSSHFSDPNLSFSIQPRPLPGHSAVGWQREGAIAKQGNRIHLLSAPQHGLWQAVDAFNQRPDDQRGFEHHLAFWAQVRDLTAQPGILISQHLMDESAHLPSQVSVAVEALPDGSLLLHPKLGEVDDLSWDHLGPRDRPLPTVLTIKKHHLTQRKRVVLGDAQKRGLEQIRTHRHIPKEKALEFINHPEIHLDPNLVDLSGFSERVIGIGEAPSSIHPLIQREPKSWKPTAVSLVVSRMENDSLVEEEVILHSTADLAPFIKAHELAKAANQSTFHLGEHSLPVGDQTGRDFLLLSQALEAIAETSKEVAVGLPEAPTSEALPQEPSTKPAVLLVSENIEELGYAPAQSPTEAGQSPATFERPNGLRPHIQLLPHQEDGVAILQKAWRAKLPGLLLADDMGLGKTLQVLTFWRWCRNQEPDLGPMLVVAPVALLENWSDELDKFLEDCPGGCIQLHGSRMHSHKITGAQGHELAQGAPIKKLKTDELQKTGIILTNYETVRNYQFSLASLRLGLLVLDEAQKAKNPLAHQTRAIKALNARFQLVATGTPVENDLTDLWSLMDIAQPGLLGSLAHFRSQFSIDPLESDQPQMESLKNKVQSSMIRRLKKDILKDLPEKTTHAHHTPMSDFQQARYLEILAETNKNRQDSLAMIAALQMLRLTSIHPNLLQSEGWAQLQHHKMAAESPKLEHILSLVQGWKAQGSKGVLFAREKPVQRALQKLIRDRMGYESEVVNGEVPGAASGSGPTRKRLIDRFQEAAGFGAIILSPEAVGYGLTITAATQVVHVTRLWNPAKEDQATDRVHRIGQTQRVHVHTPLATCKGLASFDLVLDELQRDKRQLASHLLCPSNRLDVERTMVDRIWS